jgi:hypothetical protein
MRKAFVGKHLYGPAFTRENLPAIPFFIDDVTARGASSS